MCGLGKICRGHEGTHPGISGEWPVRLTEEAKELADQTDALTRQLTEDLTLNAASPEVQEKLKKLIVFTENTGWSRQHRQALLVFFGRRLSFESILSGDS